MITSKSLARVKPGLDDKDAALNEFLSRSYDHETQMRNVGPHGEETELYPTSTRFDGDRT
jgi:hypothetical protein